jgi:hypothetical protein
MPGKDASGSMNRAFRCARNGVLPLAFLVLGCKNTKSPTHEVAHVVSPNGKVLAVLTETNEGATTSFGYEVSVAPKDTEKFHPVASLYGAIRNEQAYGVNLSWLDNHILQVQYLRAKAVENLSNSINVDGQEVEVHLQSGVEDPNAPSGGMQYNIAKQSR